MPGAGQSATLQRAANDKFGDYINDSQGRYKRSLDSRKYLVGLDESTMY